MKALQELSRLSLEAKKAKFPNVPPHGLVVPKFSDKTSSELTKSIVEYFRLMGGYATRINTQGQYREGLGWTKGTTALGTADIHACLHGIYYSIEVKIGADQQSEHQFKTQYQVQRWRKRALLQDSK